MRCICSSILSNSQFNRIIIMEETKTEEKKEDEPKEDAPKEEGLVKTLQEQEERIDAKALALQKKELAFNARVREAKMSGKTLATPPGTEPKDPESEARIKAIGDATGAKWAKEM